MPQILILGASGRLGQACVQAFHQAGWQVLAQSRQARSPAWPKDVVYLPGDAEHLPGVPDRLDAVLQAANPPYDRWTELAWPMNRAALAHAERTGALFLFPGNVYNHGPQLPAQLSEDSAFDRQHNTRKGAVRVQIEDELAQAARAGKVRVAILRAGDFFGSGSGTWLDLALAKDLIKARPGDRVTYPGRIDQCHAWAYLPDLARAFVALAGSAASLAPFSTHVFEGHAVTGQAFFDALGKACQALNLSGGHPVLPTRLRLQGMPWPIMKLISLFNPLLREVIEMRYLWDRPHRLVSHSPLREALHRGATPFDQAVTQALRDLRT